jgi:uncharacterized phage-associated protein
MMKALDVAAALIEEVRSQRKENLSNLKLQKLLYYAQGWHLAFYDGAPLFEDAIEAWIHGPVVPSIYRRFKVFTWKPITDQFEPIDLSFDTQQHLEGIVQAYGHLSPEELEIRTHDEDPWKDARNGIPSEMASNAVITEDAMREFFEEQALLQCV